MSGHTYMICDVCGKPPPGVFMRFRTALRGEVYEWDVGGCCYDQPFKPRKARTVQVTITVSP